MEETRWSVRLVEVRPTGVSSSLDVPRPTNQQPRRDDGVRLGRLQVGNDRSPFATPFHNRSPVATVTYVACQQDFLELSDRTNTAGASFARTRRVSNCITNAIALQLQLCRKSRAGRNLGAGNVVR